MGHIRSRTEAPPVVSTLPPENGIVDSGRSLSFILIHWTPFEKCHFLVMRTRLAISFRVCGILRAVNAFVAGTSSCSLRLDVQKREVKGCRGAFSCIGAMLAPFSARREPCHFILLRLHFGNSRRYHKSFFIRGMRRSAHRDFGGVVSRVPS